MKYEELVSENLGLVHLCCNKMRNHTVEYEDLYSVGCIGLCKAAKKFDENKGFKFSTYAVPVILGEIKQLLRDNNPIKVSRSLKELSLKANRENNRLKLQLGREPTITELAKSLNTSAEHLSEALNASLVIKSLDTDTHLFCKEKTEIEEKTDAKITILQALDNLEQNDKKIIVLRYFKDKTQTEVAKELGLTQVQISRREKTILKNLRFKLNL